MTVEKQTFATVASRLATGDEPSITISTVSLDRDQDIVEPEGAVLEPYLKNPVVGVQHFRTDPLPIGTTTQLVVEPGRGIRASWRWLENDPLADRVRNAFEQHVINAASIGFIPLEWEPIRETGGTRFVRWELTEWSLCAVPSNRESLRTLRELGLWDDDEPVVFVSDEPEVIEVDAELFALAHAVSARAISRRRLDPSVRAGLVEPELYDVDPAILRLAIRELWADELGPDIRRLAREQARRAIDRIRGRLD